MTDLLYTGPEDAAASFLLAHGAGAPMDSDFMNAIADALAQSGIQVIRFEFPYMAARRETGSKRPPPKAETMMDFFRQLVAETQVAGNLYIGGKSMGGRIASLIADEVFASGAVQGLVCLGYPFHPPGKPENTRTAHLEMLRMPTLICQGERDPFGTRDDVSDYALSQSIAINWLPDGNHDLAPRKASGRTAEQNRSQAAEAIAAFFRMSGSTATVTRSQ